MAELDEIRGRLADYLNSVTQSRGKGFYNCPLCGSGTKNGGKGTPAFSVMKNRDGTPVWKCFSCGEGGDIFDLYGKINGLNDFSEQLKGLASFFGISYKPRYNSNGYALDWNDTIQEDEPPKETPPETDYTAFFQTARENIENTDYWKKRGLTAEIIDRFGIGYIDHWRHPKAPNSPITPRLIIPTSAHSYLARDTRTDIPEQQKPYSKSKVGRVSLFNGDTLKTAQTPVYVVEGEIDALSIIQSGGNAVALGGVCNINKFVELLKASENKPPIIIALDNDEAGQKAAEKLKTELTAIGVSFTEYPVSFECKDANELLQKDPEQLANAVQIGIAAVLAEQENAQAEQEAQADKEKDEYAAESNGGQLLKFAEYIEYRKSHPPIKTGFNGLDNATGGGLREGLIVIGAIPSLGKTTLALQIADNIAKNGGSVLFVSLEMGRYEIMAKSISRETHTINDNGGLFTNTILDGRATGANAELFRAATDRYKAYARNVFILEGTEKIGTAEIRAAAERHKRITGQTPVVFVDYLQIIAPADIKATDKVNTDKAITELKRISRDLHTPVVAISSINRQNYKSGKIDFEAFKESGGIEYGADLLIGLQFSAAGTKEYSASREKAKDPREISALILKNRNGSTGGVIPLLFSAKYNYFSEPTTAERYLQSR